MILLGCFFVLKDCRISGSYNVELLVISCLLVGGETRRMSSVIGDSLSSLCDDDATLVLGRTFFFWRGGDLWE
jgi:hypothetical protein